MKYLLLLPLLFASPASAGEVTGSAFWHHSSTSQYASPNHQHELAGEFSVAYTSAAKLAPFGEVSTQLKKVGDRFSVAGVFYHVGVQAKVTDSILLVVKHGSWHNLDAGGRTELYNKVGIQFKL